MTMQDSKPTLSFGWHKTFLLAIFASIVLCLLLVKSPTAQASSVHWVSKGESLWLISQWYKTPMDQIRSYNGLSGNAIFPGQKLVIPDKTSPGSSDLPSRSGGFGRYTREEVDLLARLISSEAEGESYLGKVAVGAVVLNRVRSSIFPNTIAGVIYQPGQFEPVDNGRINNPPTEESLRAARDVLNGWDPTGGALYFFNPNKAYSYFLWARPIRKWIGLHVFLA
jgi:N-acetylmuramoyl-L-alanine amidase